MPRTLGSIACSHSQPPTHPPALQSVLAIVLGSDRQWVGSVSTVAGVVVLRTLLQVRACLGEGQQWELLH